MKLFRKSNLLRRPLTVFCIFSILAIVGCENSFFDNNVNLNEISSSEEFKEYMTASFDLYLAKEKLIRNCNTLAEKDGNQHTAPKKNRTSLSYELLKNVSEARMNLISRFPSYTALKKEDKMQLASMAVEESDEIIKKYPDLFTQELTPAVRLKSTTENNQYETHYSDWSDAFAAAIDYSESAGVECSGYLFADGSAILYLDPNAEYQCTGFPTPIDIGAGSVTLYNGQIIDATFHTHPNTPNFSGSDNDAQSNYFPNCDMYILYGGNSYYYHYEDGYYWP